MRLYLSCKHGKVAVLMPSTSNQFRMRTVTVVAPGSVPASGGDVVRGTVEVVQDSVVRLPVAGAPASAPLPPAHTRVLVCGDFEWETSFFLASLITDCLHPLPSSFTGGAHPVHGQLLTLPHTSAHALTAPRSLLVCRLSVAVRASVCVAPASASGTGSASSAV